MYIETLKFTIVAYFTEPNDQFLDEAEGTIDSEVTFIPAIVYVPYQYTINLLSEIIFVGNIPDFVESTLQSMENVHQYSHNEHQQKISINITASILVNAMVTDETIYVNTETHQFDYENRDNELYEQLNAVFTDSFDFIKIKRGGFGSAELHRLLMKGL